MSNGKYLQIKPATETEPGLCVQPTMEKPMKLSVVDFNFLLPDDKFSYTQEWAKWEEHLLSLPKLHTTCTLPAGEWFEGRESYEINESGRWVEYDKAVCERYFGNNKTRVIIAYVSKYQVKDLDGSWINCDKERYDRELKSYRRVYETDHTKFYCKEWDNVGYQCEEQCDRCKKADNAPEVIVPVEQKDAEETLVTVGRLVKQKMSENLVDSVPGFVGDTFDRLLSDTVYPNSIPIIIFRNMVRLLNISFPQIVAAMWVTFGKLDKAKQSSNRLDTRSDLWECKEALQKYINRLWELLNDDDVEQKDEPKDEGFDWRGLVDRIAIYLGSELDPDKMPWYFQANQIAEIIIKPWVEKYTQPEPPKVESQPAPKEGSEFVKLLDKYGCGREMFTENELSMISGAVRELMDRIWDAGVKWEWIEHLNQEREEEGSPRGINPCPDKETFISSLF